ncbi:MAG: N5-carboxyaminoimidazole ribonucleotide synthase [Alphaproteobacteria bacterium MarineAlpha9_Bin3]|nr:MAG: N5-carboxyaminoimidazole ribonucleotide synthase [Alphaproteobacteria bacterium MarineAlpha9_Bin3]
MKNKILGIIGGGQLGRMTALAAAKYGIECHVFDPDHDAPAFQVCSKSFINDYKDLKAIEEFSSGVDAVLYEFENIPLSSAKHIEKFSLLRPSSFILSVSQDRLVEKKFLCEKAKVKTAKFYECSSYENLESSFNEIKGLSVLKTRRFGYDGKGQIKLDDHANLKKVWESIGSDELILEEFVPFKRELSIIIARDYSGKVKLYDIVENKHKNHILDQTIAPAPNISNDSKNKAKSIAIKIATELGLVGLLAIELFELNDGELLVNEIAPRPHNSGHWTMDGCVTDQFEQAVRATMGIELGSTEILYNVIMQNLIGKDIFLVDKYINDPHCRVHNYGKKEVRSGRKMGHINHIKI